MGPRRTPTRRWRFRGTIAGVGTEAGVRIVVGSWQESPLGAFADVMVELPDGHRVLLAPTAEVADFVGATYRFDEVRIGAVVVGREGTRRLVQAPGLDLELQTGGRPALGRLLRMVPGPLARSTPWASLVDPVARRVLRGVRTRGSAGGGRREWYAATDLRRIVAVRARWEGKDLGGLRPVLPPTRFGFSAPPAAPSLVAVSTTVALPGARRVRPDPRGEAAGGTGA